MVAFVVLFFIQKYAHFLTFKNIEKGRDITKKWGFWEKFKGEGLRILVNFLGVSLKDSKCLSKNFRSGPP